MPKEKLVKVVVTNCRGLNCTSSDTWFALSNIHKIKQLRPLRPADHANNGNGTAAQTHRDSFKQLNLAPGDYIFWHEQEPQQGYIARALFRIPVGEGFEALANGIESGEFSGVSLTQYEKLAAEPEGVPRDIYNNLDLDGKWLIPYTCRIWVDCPTRAVFVLTEGNREKICYTTKLPNNISEAVKLVS